MKHFFKVPLALYVVTCPVLGGSGERMVGCQEWILEYPVRYWVHISFSEDVFLFTECRSSGGWENLATGGVCSVAWVYTTAGSVISPIL